MNHNRIRPNVGAQAGIARPADGFAAIPGSSSATERQPSTDRLACEQARRELAMQKRLAQLRLQLFRWN